MVFTAAPTKIPRLRVPTERLDLALPLNSFQRLTFERAKANLLPEAFLVSFQELLHQKLVVWLFCCVFTIIDLALFIFVKVGVEVDKPETDISFLSVQTLLSDHLLDLHLHVGEVRLFANIDSGVTYLDSLSLSLHGHTIRMESDFFISQCLLMLVQTLTPEVPLNFAVMEIIKQLVH